MAQSTAAPQQHKQTSRKGKKAWRKNVDISEVQEGLATARDEVIRTGGIIAERPSDELFTVDTKGSEEIRKKVAKTIKPLKADQIIALRSKVPAVDTRRRAAKGTTDGIIEPSTKRRKTGGVSYKELERLKARAYGGKGMEKDLIQTGNAPAEDPWAVQVPEVDSHFSFLREEKKPVAPKTIKEPPISLLEGGKSLPAVAKPKGGISYNPEFSEWDQLLKHEGDKEVLAERQRLQEAKEEAEKQATIEAAEAEAKAEEGGYYTEDESVWEGIESDYEGAEWLKKKRPERKTPAERNKIKRRKAAEREAKHQARVAERNARGGRKTEGEGGKVVGKEQAVTPAVVPDSSDEEVDDSRLRRRKFGTVPIPDKPLEVVLPDELQDSLRLLKPEGNLLKERFRNYLVGGKVETRRPGFQAKKAKRKATEKWTYKDWAIPA